MSESRKWTRLCGIALVVTGLLQVVIAAALALMLMSETYQEDLAESMRDAPPMLRENPTLVVIGFYAAFGSVGAMVTLGGACMARERGWALALFGAILAILPIFNPCCVPVGIAALIVLLRADVRERMMT